MQLSNQSLAFGMRSKGRGPESHLTSSGLRPGPHPAVILFLEIRFVPALSLKADSGSSSGYGRSATSQAVGAIIIGVPVFDCAEDLLDWLRSGTWLRADSRSSYGYGSAIHSYSVRTSRLKVCPGLLRNRPFLLGPRTWWLGLSCGSGYPM